MCFSSIIYIIYTYIICSHPLTRINTPDGYICWPHGSFIVCSKKGPATHGDQEPSESLGNPGSPDKTQGFTEGLLKGRLNRFPFNPLVVSPAAFSCIDINISSASAAGNLPYNKNGWVYSKYKGCCMVYRDCENLHHTNVNHGLFCSDALLDSNAARFVSLGKSP